MSIQISQAGLAPTLKTQALDEHKQIRTINIAGERPLIIRIDDLEIVTLMTLGTHPEALVLGYLRNQRFISAIDDLIRIEVNWQTESANVWTKNGIDNLDKRVARRIITTGCGQGTVFSCTMDEIYNQQLAQTILKQTTLYALLKNVSKHNAIYQSAGAVHSCALCHQDQVIIAVEDVGRHNAADAIAGLMWLNNHRDENFIFYTTGRITSEIVMKVAQMGLSVLISRSGITQMGLELAEQVGMLVIARAKGRHFLVFGESKRLLFDQIEKKTAQ